MARFVPQSCIAYAEIESVSELIDSLGANESWEKSFPGWKKTSSIVHSPFSRFAARTGLGPSEIVVLGRAQIAVAVFDLESVDVGVSLSVKPHVAMIVDTHSWNLRTKSVVEELVGGFANRAYGNPQVNHYDSEGASWTEWISSDNQRHIFAAVKDNLAVIANDSAAVKACLATGSNIESSMLKSDELIHARSDLVKSRTLAFGFVTPAGTSKLIEVLA